MNIYSSVIDQLLVLSRSDLMVGMGYCRDEINDSLAKMKYDDITATYLLLGRKAAEVRRYRGNYRCPLGYQQD